MGKLRQPVIRPGNLCVLLGELYKLHGRAGWPSLRDMARGQTFSYNTVHELFTKTTAAAPRLPVLMAVVEMLACIAPRTDLEATLDQFDSLWRAANDAPFEAPPETPPDSDPISRSIAPLDDAIVNIRRVVSATHLAPVPASKPLLFIFTKSEFADALRAIKGPYSLKELRLRSENLVADPNGLSFTPVTLFPSTTSNWLTGKALPTEDALRTFLAASGANLGDPFIDAWLDALRRVSGSTVSSISAKRSALRLRLDTEMCTLSRIVQLKGILTSYPGPFEVHLEIVNGSRSNVWRLDDALTVADSPELLTRLRILLGPEAVRPLTYIDPPI